MRAPTNPAKAARPENSNRWLDATAVEPFLTMRPDARRAREALAKAYELKGLDFADVAALIAETDPGFLKEMFAAARYVKETIYGRRIVFLRPCIFRISAPTNAPTAHSGKATTVLYAMP